MAQRRILKLAEPRFSQSLERGLAVLGCFDSEHPVLGIADLADQLGLSRSTTHRYVVTLVELGYLEQESNRKYRLGLRVTDLGMSALDSISMREYAHPHLQRLARETGLTAVLGVLDGSEVLVVQIARGSMASAQESSLNLHVGSRLPAHCTAIGKLILAHLSEQELARALDQLELSKHAPNTITTKKRLLQDLKSARELGIALEDRELADGLRGIAVPVYDENTEVGAAIGLLTTRPTSAADLPGAYGTALQRAANQTSTRPSNKRQ